MNPLLNMDTRTQTITYISPCGHPHTLPLPFSSQGNHYLNLVLNVDIVESRNLEGLISIYYINKTFIVF